MASSESAAGGGEIWQGGKGVGGGGGALDFGFWILDWGAGRGAGVISGSVPLRRGRARGGSGWSPWWASVQRRAARLGQGKSEIMVRFPW